MPGDLWTGYLQAQAADVAEVEREEGKKRQRLEDQLQKLNMEGLRRRIDRDAQKWEIEKEARTRTEGAFERLRGIVPSEYLDAALAGIDLSKLGPEKEQEPWFIGTPHQERGLSKEFYTKPETETTEKLPTVSEITKGMEALYPKSYEFKEGLEPTTPADSLWAGLITAPRREEEVPFFAGKERLTSLLTGLTPPTKPTPPEAPQIELPPTLVKELGDFKTFDKWYDSLPQDAKTELAAEPETLKAIKEWYAVSR